MQYLPQTLESRLFVSSRNLPWTIIRSKIQDHSCSQCLFPQPEVEFGENVDLTAFEQILDMDEEDDRDFSKSIVFGFLEQAESTFTKMDKAQLAPLRTLARFHLLTDSLNSKDKDLEELSSLGHFLKGSSATLGFTLVKNECEKIQHYGHKKNDTGEADEPDEEKCLRLCKESITEAKRAYRIVDGLMRLYYDDPDYAMAPSTMNSA